MRCSNLETAVSASMCTLSVHGGLTGDSSYGRCERKKERRQEHGGNASLADCLLGVCSRNDVVLIGGLKLSLPALRSLQSSPLFKRAQIRIASGRMRCAIDPLHVSR